MRSPLPLLVIILLWLVSCPRCAEAQQPTLRQPVYWRQNVFAIPFRVAPSPDRDTSAIEVVLFVSTDQGATWQRPSRVDAQDGQFTYRAPQDGEYWFAVQSVGPAGPMQVNVASPQLRVIVDTVAPQMELKARSEPDGAVTAEWRIHEEHLDARSFMLEFRADSGSYQWQEIAVQPPQKDRQQSHYEGHARWYPQGATDAILLRARVRDLAGNPAWSQTEVSLNSEPAGGEIEEIERPWADVAAEDNQQLPDDGDSRRRWLPDGVTDEPLSQDPGVASSAAPVRQEELPPNRQSDHVPIRRPRRREKLLPAYRHEDAARPDRTAARPPQDAGQNGPQSSPVNPPVADNYGRPGEGVGSAGDGWLGSSAASPQKNTLPFSIADLPEGAWPRTIDSTQFELEYEIDSAEPSRVELWGTTDGGRTWRYYAGDPDGQSPMFVEVAGDGLYGFRLLTNPLGTGTTDGPVEGDEPELWVAVDRTPPVARILGIEQGTGHGARELVIDWMAIDEVAVAEQPVSLYFGDSPDGPWFAIAEGLTNTDPDPGTGRFVWRLPGRVTGSIYLRLQVGDAAGNETTTVSDRPIELKSPSTDTRIRDVRPRHSRD